MLDFFQKFFFTSGNRSELEERLLQAKKMEAIGRLAGGVAHDFNNVLTAICGYNDLLSGAVASDARLVEYTREIQKAADRAAALTTQLLGFSRRHTAAPRLLNLNRMISDIGTMLQCMIGAEVRIVTHLAPGLKCITANPAQIDQVLMNLAVNARDAMPSGGKLTIETANVELTGGFRGRPSCLPPGSYVMLSISDTGTGMDADTKGRLFEPFFTTKECGRGTGLGLAIVHDVVKQNRGEILVYSAPGKGTTMKIYLPAAGHEETADSGIGAAVHSAERA